ncbi:hypothetical protein [Sediminicola luteus]|uniref:Calx-beta domain-containing protein n=1 Tax=Sediminicola luteus TaxID=319238 RepID=A0A2A4G7Y4_9FLAO|nr:hypothetical protein [Sediminicola luteus]PCE64543.1 hypothetical protein B7P33_09680 [Sediminicola luteus]
MKKSIFLVIAVVLGLANYNCEEAPSLTQSPAEFVSFEAESAKVLVQLNGTGSLDLKVFSTYTSNSARTFDLAIDEASTASPASYNVPATVEIPAGSNEGVINMTFTDTEISNSGETLILNFQPVDGSFVGSSTTIDLVRDCPSNLEGNYVYTNGTGKAVTITRTGATTYTVSADNAFGTDYPFNISDTCNEILVTGGVIEDNFGLAVSGTGTVDANTGTITISYTVENQFTDREMILEKQ